MKKSRFSDAEILDALSRVKAGLAVPALCAELGISGATYYKWRAKFATVEPSTLPRIKALEDELRLLRKLYTEEKRKADIAIASLAKK